MPYTAQQIRRIVGRQGSRVIPKGAIPQLAQRVSESEVRRRLYSFEDRAAADLFALFEKAYADIRTASATLADELGISGALEMDSAGMRWKTQLASYQDARLRGLMMDAAKLTAERGQTAFAAGYLGRAWSADVSTRPEVQVRYRLPMPERIRDLLATDWEKREGETLMGSFNLAAQEVTAKTRRVLNTALIDGETPAQAVMKVGDALGVRDGKAAYWRAQNLVRSGVMAAGNLGAVVLYRENARGENPREEIAGLGLAAIFVTAGDGRVCPICRGFAGRIWRLDTLADAVLTALTMPVPPIHYGCRCGHVYVILPTLMLPDDMPPGLTWLEWLALEGLTGVLDNFMGEGVSDGDF